MVGKKDSCKLFLFIFSIILMPFVASNGLLIVEGEIINISKTFDQDYYTNITIRNSEPFDFHNVSFEINPHIYMDKIPTLLSGENKTVQVKIVTNDIIDLQIKLRGFYETTIGMLNDTHEVTIDYSEGLSQCNIPDAVIGDKIKWINQESYEVKIRNADTLEDFTTISGDDSFEYKFETPQVFSYWVLRSGIKFAPPNGFCEINILPDSGFVNNPLYDAQINLITDIVYEPTTIAVTIPTRNYNMDFIDEQDGILTIKNTGSNPAKNINLDGDIFSFSANNFHLEPGISKNVGYTINLFNLISSSNDTNKTYSKKIKINGNFNEVEEEFQIFINYAQFSFNESEDGRSLIDIIMNFCIDNPTSDVCVPQIIYKYIENDSFEFNATMTQEQFWGMVDESFKFYDEQREQNKIDREKDDALNQTLTDFLNKDNETRNEIVEIKDKLNKDGTKVDIISWVLITLVLLALGCTGFYILYRNKQQSDFEKL